MHWSRFIDAPLAFLISIFSSVIPLATAVKLTSFIWPLLLLLPFFLIVAKLTTRLVGKEAVFFALLMSALSGRTFIQFYPGRIDHHNIQIILSLALVYFSLDAHKNLKHALGAGLAAGLSLAIGLETLHIITVAIAVIMISWVIGGAKHLFNLQAFTLAFFATITLSFLLTVSPSRYNIGSCDAISPVYILASVLLALSSLFPIFLTKQLQSLWSRLALISLSAGVSFSILFLVYPACIGGPYGEMPQELKESWLVQISEIQSIFVSIERYGLFVTLGTYFLLFSGFGAALYLWHHETGENKRRWFIMLNFILITSVLALFQIRGIRLTGGLLMPAIGLILLTYWKKYWFAPDEDRIKYLLAFFGFYMLFSAMTHNGLGQYFSSLTTQPHISKGSKSSKNSSIPKSDRISSQKNQKSNCQKEKNIQLLNQLTPGLVIADSDFGSHIIAFSHHAVLTANFHRNSKGILLEIDIQKENPKRAHALLKQVKATYYMKCQDTGHFSQESLYKMVRTGQTPEWLEKINLKTKAPFDIFRIHYPAR